MSRPVKTNSTCPRYAYFRARYLILKANTPPPKPKRVNPRTDTNRRDRQKRQAETLKAVEAFLKLPVRSEIRITWNELSRGVSNT